ncbi:MAG: Hydrogenase 2 maturation protease [Phycisphaerae bacterium]|nr:Hydrogenase 2 maturation protease [Phycisphaerae bacterium]
MNRSASNPGTRNRDGIERSRGRTVVLGCGRWSMGDDQAGLRVAERLRGMLPPDVRVMADENPGVALLSTVDPRDHLIIIDAAPADDAHPAGTYTVVTPNRLIETAAEGGSTHQVGVRVGLTILAALGTLPRRVSIFALFGRSFRRSLQMSPEVAAAVEAVAERVVQEVSAPVRGEQSCTS